MEILNTVEQPHNKIDELIDEEIEKALAYCGIYKNSTNRVSYRNRKKFLELVKHFTGYPKERIMKRAIHYVSVDRRYLDEYLDGFLEWEIIELNNSKIIWKGLPKNDNLSKPEHPEIKQNSDSNEAVKPESDTTE